MDEISGHFRRKTERCREKERYLEEWPLSHEGVWTVDNGDPEKDHNANFFIL